MIRRNSASLRVGQHIGHYKRKNTKRLGGVEATYAGRIAGRCLAVSATGAEYMLDPEAVAHAGLREGTALVVRAVPGDFATFRKTVASPKKRMNGAKSVADPVAARELELYIENEGALVAAANSMGRMIMRNLAGMITRGTYDSTKAWKAWMPLADEGAKRYTREYGDRFGTVFNKATREMVANRLAEAFESEVRTGAINLATLLAPRANRRTRKNAGSSADTFARAVANEMAKLRGYNSTATAPAAVRDDIFHTLDRHAAAYTRAYSAGRTPAATAKTIQYAEWGS